MLEVKCPAVQDLLQLLTDQIFFITRRRGRDGSLQVIDYRGHYYQCQVQLYVHYTKVLL